MEPGSRQTAGKGRWGGEVQRGGWGRGVSFAGQPGDSRSTPGGPRVNLW